MKSNHSNNYLKIGEISKKTGISVSALRYYERIGLLFPAFVSDSNYRYYQETDIGALIFIKKAQYLGFSLDEIKEIMHEQKQGRSPCPKVKQLAKKKITELQKKINSLKRLERVLKDYVIDCSENVLETFKKTNTCKLIDKVQL